MLSETTTQISKKTGVCGGRACIDGHRIRVMDIVHWHERRGYSPDEIVELLPTITLAQVHAALAYYFDHQEEIRQDFEADAAVVSNTSSKLSGLIRG